MYLLLLLSKLVHISHKSVDFRRDIRRPTYYALRRIGRSDNKLNDIRFSLRDQFLSVKIAVEYM